MPVAVQGAKTLSDGVHLPVCDRRTYRTRNARYGIGGEQPSPLVDAGSNYRSWWNAETFRDGSRESCLLPAWVPGHGGSGSCCSGETLPSVLQWL